MWVHHADPRPHHDADEGVAKREQAPWNNDQKHQ
jgi:hypothetical protein